jgi:4-hydroxy-tetrahydrodipicolinate reductase
MGRLVTELVAATDDLRLVALVTEPGRAQEPGCFHPELPLTGQDNLARVNPRGGVIVDFSLALALDGLLTGASASDAALVIGTTGYDAAQQQRIAVYARHRPVVLAANFSLGIPALQLLLRQLARTLPEGFQAEEVEIHHCRKFDRPSGTARWLADAWCQARGQEQVPIHSQRLGGVIGEHAWTICDEEETLQLVHRAHSRKAFLRGVVPAVRFVAQQQEGLYDLTDVLAAQGDIREGGTASTPGPS